jgi:CYTH domain-containing protein
MNNHSASFRKNDWKRVFAFICALQFLSPALQAEETCPVEVKLLLSPATIQTVIASLSFEKETATRVYFFDTDALDLLKQGVIVRVRQGADNDLTVKVRVPDSLQVDTSRLREHFPCEIDRTGAGENTSYAVRRKYKTLHVPEMGKDISSLLNPSQERLLREAGVAIDWARVMQIATIKSTKWETTAQPPFRKLALELWEWSAGNILEISTQVSADVGPAKYAELQQMANMKGLSLSAEQGTKTRAVLETLTARAR